MRLHFFIIASLLFLGASAQAPLAELPMTMRGRLLFVDVYLNEDTTPLHVLFDTGAGVTVVDAQLARARGLVLADPLTIGTSGKPVLAARSPGNSLRLGEGYTLDSVELYLMDLAHLSAHYKTPVDAIIGTDLLSRVVVCTDLDAMRLRIHDPETYVHAGSTTGLSVTELDSGTYGFPMQVVPAGREDVIEVLMKLDTGADNDLTFYNHAVEAHGLMRAGKRYRGTKGFGAEPTVTHNRKGRLASASVGGRTWRKLPVVFQVDPVSAASRHASDGLIGQGLLNHFVITYHFPAGLVYLEPRR
ncbi:MAG TPA: retropepsin-like aspartic protease [Flavobacteriales bacterium]|nr:retropepsin-like aspartic protease [Flavobacteriales bacterium]